VACCSSCRESEGREVTGHLSCGRRRPPPLHPHSHGESSTATGFYFLRAASWRGLLRSGTAAASLLLWYGRECTRGRREGERESSREEEASVVDDRPWRMI
jgi:hypothetical protein